MSDYALEYADGRVSEIVADNDNQATAAALARFDDDAVACEQWDSRGRNDDGKPVERLLIWENEGDAENDPGAKAVAELTVVRR